MGKKKDYVESERFDPENFLELKKIYPENFWMRKKFTGIWDWENFTGIWDYRYLCRGIQCKGRREARASLRRGGEC